MPFQAGQSGNPAGRPRGARNKTTLLVAEVLADNAQAIVRRLIDQAQAGNPASMAMLARSLLPRPKGEPIHIDLPELEKASDAPTAIAAIYAAVCAGALVPADGNALIRMVEAFLRVIQKTGNAERRPEMEQTAQLAAATTAPDPIEPHGSLERNAHSEPVIPARRENDPGTRPHLAASGMTTLAWENAARSLPQLRQEVLSGTSPLAQRVPRQPVVVSHCIPVREAPAPTPASRAAA